MECDFGVLRVPWPRDEGGNGRIEVEVNDLALFSCLYMRCFAGRFLHQVVNCERIVDVGFQGWPQSLISSQVGHGWSSCIMGR